jgi:hypothetical protein
MKLSLVSLNQGTVIPLRADNLLDAYEEARDLWTIISGDVYIVDDSRYEIISHFHI